MIAYLMLLCAVAALVLLGVAIYTSRPRGRTFSLANIATGRWPGRKGYIADADIASYFLLVKLGSDSGHIAVCSVNDLPLGPCTDSPDAGDAANVNLLGLAHETEIGVASGAIAADALLVPGAGGTVRTLPAAAGTYWVIGRALDAAPTGEEVAYVPCFPTLRVVA